MSKAVTDVVAYWFAERMASGPLARDDAAHAQAIAARDDLVKRLMSAKGDVAETVTTWFTETIANGAIARNTAAYSHAFAARADLIERLGGNGAPANVVRRPTVKPPPKVKAKADPAPLKAPAEPVVPAKAETKTPA